MAISNLMPLQFVDIQPEAQSRFQKRSVRTATHTASPPNLSECAQTHTGALLRINSTHIFTCMQIHSQKNKHKCKH